MVGSYMRSILALLTTTESYRDLDDYLDIVATPMNLELLLDKVNAGLAKDLA